MKKLIIAQARVDHSRSRIPGEAASSGGPGEEPDRITSWSHVVLRLVGLTAMVLLPCVVIAAIFSRTSEATRQWWLSESGPVELASGWGYVLLAVGLMIVGAMRLGKVHMQRDRSRTGNRSVATWHPLLLGSCVATLAAREFDWHNIWTTRSVLKTRFYVDPAISIGEKLAVSAVLCLIGLLVVTTIGAYGSKLLYQLRRGQTAAWLAATGTALLPVSKALDSGPRIFADFLPDNSTNVRHFLGSVEETMELAIPALFLMAAIAAIWPRRSTTDLQTASYQPRRAA